MKTILYRLFSIPIYLKIVGVGMLTILLFGGLTLYLVRTHSVAIHYPLLEQRNRSVAESLAAHLEQRVLTGSWFEVRKRLTAEQAIYPDIRYIIVTDADGNILVHTFLRDVPRDLQEKDPRPVASMGSMQVYESKEGKIIESIVPISSGGIGFVRVGVLDKKLQKEIAAITRAVLTAMGTSAVVGLGLAVLLAFFLVRPLRRLNHATEEIRQGNLGVQATVFSDDEIGKLTRAFNHMSDQLKITRDQILEKEAARLQLVKKTVAVQEEERKRISRDLHDDLAQSLSALLLQIQSSVQKTGVQAAALFSDLEEKTKAMIETVRRLAWDLRPSILDDYGLSTALSRYIEDITRKRGTSIDFHHSSWNGKQRLPLQIEVALFRIGQEAIANILKHSRAKSASVVLMEQENEVTLLVEDDGIGFDPGTVSAVNGKHLGLLGMQERAALIGGAFALESSSGKGTIVRVKIPVRGEGL